MKRITGLLAALFLVLGIAAASFAQDTMKQDDQMMSKKPMMKKHRMMKKHHRMMKKHHRHHRKGKMMKKSMMK